jgi:hypothetical protein
MVSASILIPSHNGEKMTIDITQVSANLFVAVGSAWFGAWFGARQAIETSKRQKAFEQRLDWHLRIIRAMKRFQLGMEEYLATAKLDRKAAVPIAAKVEPLMMEFLMCTNEAALFTDRKTILRLRDGAKEFSDVLHDARRAMDERESWTGVVQRTASLTKLVESLDFELTRKLREQLGLDKLKPGDLGG